MWLHQAILQPKATNQLDNKRITSLRLCFADRVVLGSLPKNKNVKPTFAYPTSLKAGLDRYAALHAQVYGEAVDAGNVYRGGSEI
ncbi:DUF2274 domain-containing protein [Photorhabdus hindustanensis]|uniref:DUF2274 domain-containing protein n=1 Tax=Photorhabdus hindustanensis TaxID=2918802 RepID=UPI003CE4B7D2